MTGKFQVGDLVELIYDRSKKVLVTEVGKRDSVFSGVVVSAAKKDPQVNGFVGCFSDGWAENAFERIEIDYCVKFPARHKPRWRKGDLFELPLGDRFAAINDDVDPGTALILGGLARFPVSEPLPKALGVNIYDLEPRQ